MFYVVELLINFRLCDEVGDICLVFLEDCVYGDGVFWIMVVFIYFLVDGWGGCFNWDFGIYYCVVNEVVVIVELFYYWVCFLWEFWIDNII